MNCSIFQVKCNNATAFTIFHDEIHCEVFDKVIAVVAQRLSVQCVKEGVAGSGKIKG